MKIAVVGCGYVGSVVAASFARLGATVVGVEVDPEKLATLQSGRAPLREPGLDMLIQHGSARGRLTFTSNAAEAAADASLVFLCVATPDGGGGRADLGQLHSALDSLIPALTEDHVLVLKSTMPVGTSRHIQDRIVEQSRRAVPVVVNPEFLREGSAVQDFLHPDRIVLGGTSPAALERVRHAYRPILDQSFESDHGDRQTPECVITGPESAEMAKFAANAFLANRISLINEISQLCDAVGGDVEVVARAVGLDDRIGPDFLRAGLGWGGSCFDKDISLLARQARDLGMSPLLIEAIARSNRDHRAWVAKVIDEELGGVAGRRIGVLGLAFKPGTDDVRDSPAVGLVEQLVDMGATVAAHDPAVGDARALVDFERCEDALAVAIGADAVVVATDWAEYRDLDFATMRSLMAGSLAVDARNIWHPATVESAGLRYRGIGRSGDGPSRASRVTASRETG